MAALWKKLGVLGAIGCVAIACSVTSTTTNTPDIDAGTSSSSGDGGGKDTGASSSSGDANTSSSSGGDANSCQISITFGDATCDACAASKCCTEINACFQPAGSDCDKLDTCLTTCIDEAGSPSTDAGAQCANDCFTAHASGKAPWLAQAQCLLNGCKTECGG